MFIRLILLILVTNCKNFQFFNFINFLYKKCYFFKESGVGNLDDFFTDSEPPKIGKLPTPTPQPWYIRISDWRF